MIASALLCVVVVTVWAQSLESSSDFLLFLAPGMRWYRKITPPKSKRQGIGCRSVRETLKCVNASSLHCPRVRLRRRAPARPPRSGVRQPVPIYASPRVLINPVLG
jgi:hypothetical protein